MKPFGAVLGRAYALAAPEDLGNRELLARFRGGDGAAFAALVHRHGPMVHGVCRRALGDTPDADDAFQATFLLLVRKAVDLRDPDALGPWLYGVARRMALKARTIVARRRERPLVERPADFGDPDLGPTLDAAVAALPAKYRDAVVLCHFEGLSHVDAGGRLGCPPATVATRLARARERLRHWLAKRGYGPAAFAPAGPVPSALLARAAELTPGAEVPSSVAVLVEGVGRTMLMQSWSKVLACVAVFGLAGVGVWSFGPAAADPPKAARPADPQDDRIGAMIPLERLSKPVAQRYILSSQDVLGVYIEGILGERNSIPILNPTQANGRLAVGIPVPVTDDGTIELPLLPSFNVEGKTLTEVREEVRNAYVAAGVMQKGKDRTLITLAQPRIYSVTVVRRGSAAPVPASVVELSALNNDLLNALARSGHLASLDARDTITIIHRSMHTGPQTTEIQTTTIRMAQKADDSSKPLQVGLASGDIVVLERAESKEPAKP